MDKGWAQRKNVKIYVLSERNVKTTSNLIQHTNENSVFVKQRNSKILHKT
jgi:hypothetical protein